MIKKWLLFLYLIFITLDIFSQSTGIRDQEKKLVQVGDTARVNLLLKSVSEYITGDLDLADSLSQEALAISEKLDFQEGLVKSYNNLSHIKSSIGEYENGYGYAQKAIELSLRIGNKELIAQSYSHLFSILFKKGDYSQALTAAEKSLEIADEIRSIKLIAHAKDHIGIIKGINGFHKEAIEYFMESLELFEELEDEDQVAKALMHLGHTFELAGSYDKALEYLKRSLEVHQRVGNKFNEAWALVNIGVTYSRMNQVDTALSYYERSLKIAEQINDHRLILTNLDNIGGKYSLRKDFKMANQYLQKAYHLSESSGINSRTVYISGNLAENYLYMGQFDSARIFGEKQLDLALNSGLISEQKVAYYILAQVYDSLNDHYSAYKALQNYISVNDTIFSREKSQQIEELRENYEAEQKEQAISSLEKEKNAERFRRNTFAAAALLILLIGGLMFNNQRIKARKNKELLKKEQEVDQMKSKFFANITHEFRTPLTLILGPIEMLKAEINDQKIHQHLKVMGMNATRLLDLINQLLDLTKLESGSLKLKAAQGNIVPLVKGIVMSFESIAHTKKIDLSVNSSYEHMVIYYDRQKIEKILVNLLSNAIKFTAEGGKVEVRLLKTEQYFNIIIRDNGKGISAPDRERIFNRFYQSENSDESLGTGIGLALTKELIELHHGSIEVKSKVGHGTEFIVHLPLGDAHLCASEKFSVDPRIVASNINTARLFQDDESPIGKHDNTEKDVANKPLLLLIEDNSDVRNYILEILASEYQLLEARDGADGIEIALEKIPDIIISDVMMPKKNGYDVCAILKQDEKTSHIPIILLTAKITSVDKIEGLEKQADDYVTKPFVPGELMVRVRNLINSRKKLREKFQRELILKPGEVTVNSIDEQFIRKLLRTLEARIGDEKFGVEQLALEIGMSRSQIHRKLLALTNQVPNQFIRTFRLARATELLKNRNATTSEIAYQVGFSSPSYFTKCFREQYGYTPSEISENSPEASGK